MTQDFDNILEIALDWHRTGKGAVLATVVETWGSAPRGTGSQLVISAAGDMMGSVSGGCVEGAVVVEAMDAINDGKSRILEFGVSDDDAFAVGLACGGIIRILVEPVGQGMPVDLLETLVTARSQRRAIAYVVNTKTWARRLANSDEFADRFRTDKSGFEDEAFIGIHNPPLRMAVIGAVHIAQPLMVMARLAGYDAVLIDPREAFATAARFPGTTLIHDWPDDALKQRGLDARTAVVTLTHDPKIDDPAIIAALKSDVFYLGCLGSKRTHAKRVVRLQEQGLTAQDIARIHAPVGLDVGSKSPAEIAISIPGANDPSSASTHMKFGPVPVAQGLGAILAHSLDLKGKRLRKGRVLTADDLAMIVTAGFVEITVAQLDPDDIGEDDAADLIARALIASDRASGLDFTKASTGRVNIYAQTAGVLGLNVAALEAANRVDPMITIATLSPFARTKTRTMVATVKIIAYGVHRDQAQKAASQAQYAMQIHPVVLKTATLIQTDTGSGPGKGQAAIATRLEALDMTLDQTITVPHQIEPLAAEIAACRTDIVLILTASATSDTHDVAPQALRQAGGTVERFGMPVDPGNLLFIGQLDGRAVIGLPGCARSPALNGADWVLERVACGLCVADDDIAAMGVGGLLKEALPDRIPANLSNPPLYFIWP